MNNTLDVLTSEERAEYRTVKNIYTSRHSKQSSIKNNLDEIVVLYNKEELKCFFQKQWLGTIM